jgi:hypothetical protein
MNMNRFFLVVCLLVVYESRAQSLEKGYIDSEHGIGFSLFSDWNVEVAELNQLTVVSSDNSFIGVIGFEAVSMSDFQAALLEGIEIDGYFVKAAAPFKTLKDEGRIAVAVGLYQGTSFIKNAMVANVTDANGGVFVFILNATENLTLEGMLHAYQFINTIYFSKPQHSAYSLQMENTLVGKRLTYLESYSTSSFGNSSGYSMQRTIDLCSDGKCIYSSSGDLVLGGNLSTTANNKQGSWSIFPWSSNIASLRLTFKDGTTFVYEIKVTSDGMFMLNGSRYFVTDGSCY